MRLVLNVGDLVVVLTQEGDRDEYRVLGWKDGTVLIRAEPKHPVAQKADRLGVEPSKM